MLAQISDPHMVVGPGDAGAAGALAAAVADLAALEPAPDAVLVSGDLAEHGEAAEYERVAELLSPLAMPVHVLAGNHDDRDALRAEFGGNAALGAPYEFTAWAGPIRLVGCDTTIPAEAGGALDAGPAGRLARELGAEPEAPTIVAVHHVPLLIGLHALDEIGLAAADRAALAGLLAAQPQVRRVAGGHVHRTAFGMLGRCGVAVCPSTHRQARLEIGSEGFDFAPEQPAFLLHVMVDDELVTHVQPVGGRR
jgi:3',5'-cyclic-AMP phosphodiesterase